MDIETFYSYLAAISRLSAEESLMDIRTGSFSNMKKHDRDKFERSLDKLSNPDKYKPRAIKPEDVEQELHRIING